MAGQLSWLNDGFTISDIPDEWKPKYTIKRVNGEDIGIGWETRNRILEAMSSGARYVQIGEITLMVNSINSIDPVWGNNNHPPRPKPNTNVELDTKTNTAKYIINGSDEKLVLWDRLFGKSNPEIDKQGIAKIRQLKNKNKLA